MPGGDDLVYGLGHDAVLEHRLVVVKDVVGNNVGAGRSEPDPVDPVGGAVQLEAVLVAGVVGPGQVDPAAADGGGRQVARRQRRPRGRGSGGGGGSFLAAAGGASEQAQNRMANETTVNINRDLIISFVASRIPVYRARMGATREVRLL